MTQCGQLNGGESEIKVDWIAFRNSKACRASRHFGFGVVELGLIAERILA